MTAEARTATAIRFPEDLHEELAAAAEARGVSINRIVVEAVRHALPLLRPVEDFTRLIRDEAAR